MEEAGLQHGYGTGIYSGRERPRRIRRVVRALMFLCVLGGLLIAERQALDVRRSFLVTTGWSPVPSGALLRRLSFGYEKVASDVMWLKGLQYYGRQRLLRAPMPRFGEYMNAVVSLDPYFVTPYIFGALVLVQDAGEPDAGIDLLLRGMAANPERWEIPFELGFLLYVNLDQPRRAGRYFELASALEGCPTMARHFAVWTYAEGGERGGARDVCEDIIRFAQDPALKAFAEDALAKIQIEEDLETLQAAIRGFRSHTGRWPSSLKTLVSSGDILGIPPEPRGGYYAYRHESGEVESSTKIERNVNRHLGELEDALARHKAQHGEYPARLSDLVHIGLVSEVRTIFGFTFNYDSATGRVWAVDMWRT